MRVTFKMFCFAIMPLTVCLGQAQQATQLDNWHDDSIIPTSFYNNRYNECWGFSINGHEYGALGSTVGIHLIDVTDPTDIFEAFRIPGASSGANLIHRDMKDYNGYLYCVADEGPSKLQIIDLHDLPNSAPVVYSSNEFVTTSHNLYIDTAQQRLYLLGAGSSTKVLDISVPDQPVLLATYPNANFYMPYTHDGFIKNNIGFFNCGGSGLWIIDFTNPLAPVTLSTLTAYSDAGYNHSGWLTEDEQYYVLCDETHGARPKILDVSDLTEPIEVATIEPGNWDSEIPHNVLIRGNFAYFSYYYDGLEVWDISNPLNPQRAYYFDTYPNQNIPSYAGAWGVNPNLPSGNILISDMQGGLFVFEALSSQPNINITPSETEFDICSGETVSFNLSIGSDFTSNVTLSVGAGSLPAAVQFSQNPAAPGTTVQVTVSNLSSTQGLTETLTIEANNGVETSSTNIAIAVVEAPAVALQTSPTENAIDQPVNTSFQWQNVPNATGYKLEIADDLSAFDTHIVYSTNTAANSFTLSNSLDMGKSYYWRVISKNDCGQSISAIRTFKTAGVNGTSHIEGVTVKIFPNPAKDFVVVNSSAPMAKDANLTIITTTGQVMLQREFQAGATSIALPLEGFPTGVYFLKMASEKELFVQKIIVE